MHLTYSSALYNLLGIVVTLACVLVAYLKLHAFIYWKKRNVPYLEPTVPFGNLEGPTSERKPIGVFVSDFYNKARARNWKHMGLYVFGSPVYLPTDLEYVKNVLTKDFQHFTERGIYYNEEADPLSAHLFAIGGTKWRNLRKKLTPTFTSANMKIMFKTLVECGSILDRIVSDEIKINNPIDVKDILQRFTTDVIGSCAFGLEFNTFENPDSPFRVYGKKVFENSRLEFIKRLIGNVFPKLGHAIGMRKIPKDIADFFFNVVDDTIKYREVNDVVRKDFLQILINHKSDNEVSSGDGNLLTTTEIAAQCFLFFSAGFETSSTTMTFVLFELARNQDIQDKVRKEINTVLEKYNGEITYDSINEMKYMSQVIDESLRLYPPIPIATRVCSEDYNVPNTNVTIEKGTRVMIPIRGIQLDPEYYPEPEKFLPERFSDENKQKRHQYAHLAFGEGRRICIGMRFGLMQSKVGLTVMLKNYKFFVNKKTPLPLKISNTSIVTTAEGGIWLDCQKI